MFDDALQMPTAFVIYDEHGTPNAFVRFDFMEALALAAIEDGDMPELDESYRNKLYDSIFRKARNARDLLEIAFERGNYSRYEQQTGE